MIRNAGRNETGSQTPRPEHAAEVDVVKWNGYAIQAKMLSESLVINNDESAVQAVDSLKTIKVFNNDVEDARKKSLAPFSTMVSRINDTFRPIKSSLEAAETMLKSKLLSWYEAKEQKRLNFELEQIAEYERSLGSSGGAPVPLPLLTLPSENTTIGNIGAVTQRSAWKWVVEDLSKVPKEYLTIDERRVNEAVKSGIRKIPGLRIFREKTLAVR